LRERAVLACLKTVLLLLAILISLPLHAEIRGGLRGGFFENAGHDLVGTVEVDLRHGNWGIAPAYELIRGGYSLHAIHVDVRRFFPSNERAFWVGAGPTFVSTNASSSKTTWNLDAGHEWRFKSGWSPFVAARYYKFDLPAFRDRVDANGVVVSIGISRRLH
jgi:hypothetical protein